MTKKSKILELLTENNLTTKEIQEKTSYKLDLIQVYINQFKKANKVKKVDNNGKFAIYSAIKEESNNSQIKALLKQLYELMTNKMDFVKDINEKDLKLIDEIKEMIK